MKKYPTDTSIESSARLKPIIVPVVSVVVAGLLGAGLATLAICYGPMFQRWYRS